MDDYENLTLNGWNYVGNKIVGDKNGFSLSIEIEKYKEGDIPDEVRDRFEQDGLGFVLSVFSIMEHKVSFCAFTSLQECVFFVNCYIPQCKCLKDIKEKYETYLLSDDAIYQNGYC